MKFDCFGTKLLPLRTYNLTTSELFSTTGLDLRYDDANWPCATTADCYFNDFVMSNKVLHWFFYVKI